MKLSCPQCGTEIITGSMPFDEEADCTCGTHLFIDFDYNDEGPFFWLTKERA